MMPGRRSTSAAAALVVALSGLIGLGGLRVATGTSAGEVLARALGSRPRCTSAPAKSPGSVVVPIVVDFGSPGDQVSVTCVEVPNGSTGADVLSAQARVLGLAQPRYAASGLLCAIDGRPVSGCGTVHGGKYAYWAYFHGGPSWSYAEVGPASWAAVSGDVEGWRFEPNGSATPSDPAPRAASLESDLLPASPPSTTSTTTTIPRPANPPTTSAPSPGATSPPSTSSAHPGPATTQPRATRPDTAAPPSTGGGHGSKGGGGSGGTHSDPSGTGSSGDVASGASRSAAAPLGGSGTGTSSATLIGLVLALVAIAVVGGATIVRSRARVRTRARADR